MARKLEQGFTLIEAAVAIAVVAILSGIIVPLVVKNINDAQTARARNEVQVIAAALASQLRDLGTRPSVAGIAPMGTGVGNAVWGSAQGTAALGGVPAVAATQTFNQLFAGYDTPLAGAAPVKIPVASINAAWGTSAVAGAEFSWKGPYLSMDVTNKANPWGGKYYIFGYNAAGRTGSSPIWVVCPGPDNTIDTSATGNPVGTSVGLPQVWRPGVVAPTPTSADDIAVRVN